MKRNLYAMKRKILTILEVILISLCSFLFYLIVSLLLDYLLGYETPFEHTLIYSTGFAIVMTFISAYKKAKYGYYIKHRYKKNKTLHK
ncbi:hypothetical protein CJ232_08870 [Hoylesella timonensis]|jgi:hypothetical protein|uniref:Uncharacterized protein n=1 Tax=Hoylesella timonensis TaxID=386414 RepID=A0A2N6Q4B1_9BACT|nr:hypothetical protein CJ232_08870 [Hoylesella timonensis]